MLLGRAEQSPELKDEREEDHDGATSLGLAHDSGPVLASPIVLPNWELFAISGLRMSSLLPQPPFRPPLSSSLLSIPKVDGFIEPLLLTRFTQLI